MVFGSIFPTRSCSVSLSDHGSNVQLVDCSKDSLSEVDIFVSEMDFRISRDDCGTENSSSHVLEAGG